MNKQQEKIVRQIMKLSDLRHKQSLLLYEMSRCLEMKIKRNDLTTAEAKKYLKDLTEYNEGVLK